MAAGDISFVTAIDAAAFGSRRKFLIESLFRRLPQLAFVSQDNTSFVLGRPGRMATQIGPIVATNEDVADALLDAALSCVSGAIFLDLIDGAISWAPPPATRLFGATTVPADGLKPSRSIRGPRSLVHRRRA
jgi:Acetyltransferase (GNAT) domain